MEKTFLQREKSEIEKGRRLAIALLRDNSIFAAHLKLVSIEKHFNINNGNHFRTNDRIAAHLKLPEENFDLNHVMVAIIHLSSLLSAENIISSFIITNISPKTKSDNFIHEIKNKYNIRFSIALKEKAIQYQENGEFEQHEIDIEDFTIHSCDMSNINWLFLDTKNGSSFNCHSCGRKIVHLPKAKSYGKYLKLYIGGNNLQTKITFAEFNYFFKNNLFQLVSRK